MLFEYILIILYIGFETMLFFDISRRNGSWINSYTTGWASSMVIRLIPFVLALSKYNEFKNAILVFIGVLFISSITQYLGYIFGWQIRIKQLHVPLQSESVELGGQYYIVSFIIAILSFLILANNGVGLYRWIFDNRNAYLQGRAGNGLWYILFELFVIILEIIALNMYVMNRRKKYIVLISIPVILSYFTGSKGFIIGVIVLILFYVDNYIRKIRSGKIIALGICGVILIAFLLQVQSNMSLSEYSDYYYQFIRFLNYKIHGGWNFQHGKILYEDIFWSLVPRNLYPSKPYVYGQIRIVNIFFPTQSIEAGNTPSFSEFIVPYADFGIIGVGLYFFVMGFFKGTIERRFRDDLREFGLSFNAIFIYTLLFIVAPVNFSIIYIIIFCIAFIIIQSLKAKVVIIK